MSLIVSTNFWFVQNFRHGALSAPKEAAAHAAGKEAHPPHHQPPEEKYPQYDKLLEERLFISGSISAFAGAIFFAIALYLFSQRNGYYDDSNEGWIMVSGFIGALFAVIGILKMTLGGILDEYIYCRQWMRVFRQNNPSLPNIGILDEVQRKINENTTRKNRVSKVAIANTLSDHLNFGRKGHTPTAAAINKTYDELIAAHSLPCAKTAESPTN
jgi:hypothetical protein